MGRKISNHQRGTRFVDLTPSRICSELIDRDDRLASQGATWILTGWFDRINKVINMPWGFHVYCPPSTV
jgi:hypothetical protein